MAVEVLDSCDLRPFSQSATVKVGDNTVTILFVNHHDDMPGWRLLKRSEGGSLWSRPGSLNGDGQ